MLIIKKIYRMFVMRLRVTRQRHNTTQAGDHPGQASLGLSNIIKIFYINGK